MIWDVFRMGGFICAGLNFVLNFWIFIMDTFLPIQGQIFFYYRKPSVRAGALNMSNKVIVYNGIKHAKKHL